MEMKSLRPALTLTLCIALYASPLRAADEARLTELPALGDSASAILSPEQERVLGEEFMRNVRTHLPLIEDPEVELWLQSLGFRLAASSDAPEQSYRFFIVRDGTINAFAGPGGHIGANSGLILSARSESELAAVLAHEIAHVTQRHLARSLEAASKMSLPSAAALLAAILIGSQSREGGEAAIAVATAASAQYQINFTRDNEHEADRIGIQTLARADFNPQSMADFFERMQQQSRYYGNKLPEFLSTHPVTTTRIAEARERAAALKSGGTPDSLAFRLMRARLRVLTSADIAALPAEIAREGLQDPSQRYTQALALARNGRHAEARTLLQTLVNADPERITYILALAQSEFALGDSKSALARYAAALELHPDQPALVLHYTNALIESGNPRRAFELLRPRVRQGDTAPELYRQYARAAGAAGEPGEAHAAQGEYYYLMGDTSAAVEQLTVASQTPNLDYYQSARIAARLQAFKETLLEEERAQRR
jgi:predicted Zn-dependent protease